MGWSVTVNDPSNYDQFPGGIHEDWAREHESYPRDADVALEISRKLHLHSVTIAGARTPVPYDEDEIVSITITGTVNSKDFLRTVREAILSGPGDETPVYRHYAALARFREHPCRHEFIYDDKEDANIEPGHGKLRCVYCDVNLQGGRFWFDD